MTRLLIADDHEVVRSGVRSILEAQKRFEIVAEAADGRQAVQKALEFQPDVAVLDYSLPLLNGVEATRQIRARAPNVEVLMLTMHEHEALFPDLLNAGARGYLLKTDAGGLLVAAVESLAEHNPFFTTAVSETLLTSYLECHDSKKSILTPRERAVVQLIAEGHGNKSIGNILSISVKTVETHRASVMRKLNLESTAALVRYAIRNRLIEP